MTPFKHITFLILLCLPFMLQAQEEGAGDEGLKRIEIAPGSGVLEVRTLDNGQRVYYVTQGAVFKHEDIRMTCDSAVFYPDQNNVQAYGRVHIVQADSVQAWGDSLFYDGDDRTALLMSQVRLTDRTMTLTTEELFYDLERRLGRYRYGGRLVNQETRLTSKTGYYFSRSETAYFRDSVALKHPRYTLEADTLEYRVPTDLAIFHGPTTIDHEDNLVYCEGGYYDGHRQFGVFTDNAVIIDPPRTLAGDSIVYDRLSGIGKAWHNVTYKDTVQNIIQTSEYAEYEEMTGDVLSTERTVLSYVFGGDTLHITADTLRSAMDTLLQRTMYAYGRVRFYRSDMQGSCDSLVWSDSDSSIVLFEDPVLWAQANQFTGDTIVMQMSRGQIHRMDILRNAFLIGNPDTMLYDQISGRVIQGYFQDGELVRLKVNGNGQSVYYADDDGKGYMGVNKAICGNMAIRLVDQQVDRISFLSKPDADFIPIEGLSFESMKLEGFEWRDWERPRSQKDLLTYPVKPATLEMVRSLTDPEGDVHELLEATQSESIQDDLHEEGVEESAPDQEKSSPNPSEDKVSQKDG